MLDGSTLSCERLRSATMRRAAIYCRISDDRTGAGLGVARQEQDCRDLAATLSAEVVEVYVDNDISASDKRKDRPAYRALLEAVRAGQVDVVLAWHTDRLHRRPLELEEWIDACEAHGVTVHTVKAGKLDLATASGRMVARMLGSAARYESEQKRDRNLRKALELADAGKLGNGGPRPFGYQSDRVTIDPVEAALLRQAYRDVLDGKGLRTICREWHEAGIVTSNGNPWSGQALRFTLLRARNMGWREHHGRLAAPAVWQPIVDRQTWEQVRAKLTSNPGTGPRPFVRRYLLTGYLRCGLCGAPLKPSRNADVQRFGCRPDPGDGRCGKILVRYSPVEDHIVELLLARLEQQADLQPDAPPDSTDHLREQIELAEARLDALAVAYADSGDALEMRRAGQVLRERIADLRRQIGQAAVVQRLADPVQVRQAWPDYDITQRREVVDTLIERIDVAPARRGLNRFDPARLTVVWR